MPLLSKVIRAYTVNRMRIAEEGANPLCKSIRGTKRKRGHNGYKAGPANPRPAPALRDNIPIRRSTPISRDGTPVLRDDIPIRQSTPISREGTPLPRGSVPLPSQSSPIPSQRRPGRVPPPCPGRAPVASMWGPFEGRSLSGVDWREGK